MARKSLDVCYSHLAITLTFKISEDCHLWEAKKSCKVASTALQNGKGQLIYSIVPEG